MTPLGSIHHLMLGLQAHTYPKHMTISQIQPKFLIMFSSPLSLQVDLQAQHDLSKNPSLFLTVHCILTITMDARNDFATGTGTTSLHKHLANAHIKTWVLICNKQGIKITAGSVSKQVAAYCAEHSKNVEPNGTTWQKFSKEGFVDVIVEWIVADDQVRL